MRWGERLFGLHGDSWDRLQQHCDAACMKSGDRKLDRLKFCLVRILTSIDKKDQVDQTLSTQLLKVVQHQPSPLNILSKTQLEIN